MKPYLDIRPPLPPGAHLRPKRPLPYPLETPGCRLFARARVGLWHAVRALDLGVEAEVLVPPYHHGSEIEALSRAGLTCRFYRQGRDLQPDPARLDELAGPATRALYLIHYLGFPGRSERWRAWCDARGLVLIEDAAQAWLATEQGRPVGTLADVAIFCVYKSVGVPDGGAVMASGARIPEPASRSASVARRVVVGHAAWLGTRSAVFGSLRRRLEPTPTFSVDQEFALGDVEVAASRTTSRLLPRLATPEVAERRLANYRFLLERVGQLVAEPFSDPPDGASPFVFPLRVRHRPAALAALPDHGVAGLDLWSVPHPLLAVDDFPEAADLRSSVIGLPVHQELRTRELEIVARAASSVATA